MAQRPKLLILDDDPDFLDVCCQMLARLPSQPEIHTATSGTRALALLESEPFSLLLTDLRMPKMDGFQVLAIVRRRLPSQRIVVMSGAVDENVRARAYEVGIDLFVEKPKSPRETEIFFECVESMLERGARETGFRGVVEHKGLVDIIQMESLSQSSAVLKITSQRSVGYIWFLNGEVIDAATATSKAEAAFKEILGWKVGTFDLLPAEPNRARSIFTSCQGLLLQTAQALDEAPRAEQATPGAAAEPPLAPLARIGRGLKGVEYLVSQGPEGAAEGWGSDEPEAVATWARRMLEEARLLAGALRVTGPVQIEGYGPQRHLALAEREGAALVAAFDRTLSPEQVRESFQQAQEQWES